MSSLRDLRPSVRMNIIDAVEAVGHDITPWSFKEGGTLPVKDPQVNPHYCYRWSFSEDGKSSLLCLWYRKMIEEDGRIFYRGNAREEAMELERLGENPRITQEEANRAKRRAPEARRLNSAIMESERKKLPFKVAIVHSKKSDLSELDHHSADFRQLDTADWVVSKYVMETGEYELLRGGSYRQDDIHQTHSTQAENQLDHNEEFEDQFSGSPEPTYIDQTGKIVVRKRQVRLAVLHRAKGKCEYCGAIGFTTRNNKVYLETHHVVPLCEGGPDTVENVIALCANHHREAHFSNESEDIKAIHLSLLQNL